MHVMRAGFSQWLNWEAGLLMQSPHTHCNPDLDSFLRLGSRPHRFGDLISMSCDMPSFCLSQGNLGVLAPADLHDPGHRRPAGVGVCARLPVPGRLSSPRPLKRPQHPAGFLQERTSLVLILGHGSSTENRAAEFLLKINVKVDQFSAAVALIRGCLRSSYK